MMIICIILLAVSLAVSQNTVDITYLRGVRRFDDLSFMDYYFSCRVVGSRLAWEVNEDLLGFVGVQSIATVRRADGMNTISYATLLSTSAVGNGIYSYDSILIVSAKNNMAMAPSVRCFAGPGINESASTVEASTNPIVSNSSDTVFLQYLLSANIVNETLTHVYACGVNAVNLAWGVSSSTETFVFRNNPSIGENSEELSNGNTFAALKAILISLQPYQLSSVFYVTGPDIVEVRCGTGQATEIVTVQQVNDSLTATPPMVTVTTEPSSPTPTPYTTTDGNNGEGTASSSLVIEIAVPVSVGGVAVVLLFIGGIFLWKFWPCCCRYCCCCKKKMKECKQVHASSGFPAQEQQDDIKLQDHEQPV